MKELNVLINGQLAGTWTVTNGEDQFQYRPDWISRHSAVRLSRQFPLEYGRRFVGDLVHNFFDNLLPDSADVRARLGRTFGVAGADTFALLSAIGHDCAGAVQLLNPPTLLRDGDIDPLLAPALDMSTLVSSMASGIDWPDPPGIRAAVAGAQEKVALALRSAGWRRPGWGQPSTHILKAPLGLIGGSLRVNASDSVENEWVCMRLLEAMGLSVASTQVVQTESGSVLAVERFDRQSSASGSRILRHQEDFCQAMGLPSSKKYESDGGPGIRACLDLLQESSEPTDVDTFLVAQVAFALLGATDGHAKNFSLFHEPGGKCRMTPLYDVLSIWPYAGDSPGRFRIRKAGPAMVVRSKNVHRQFDTIRAWHWRALAEVHGSVTLWPKLVDLVRAAPIALAHVESTLPAGFPARTWSAISEGVRRSSERFMLESQGT